MPACRNRTLIGFPSLKMQDDRPSSPLDQGIVSILPSDSSFSTTTPASKVNSALRRTLSADMSSKSWLAHNDFPPSSNSRTMSMKKVASSEHLHEDEDHDEETTTGGGGGGSGGSAFDVIWRSIRAAEQRKDSKANYLPPYVHPLAKRSASSLSEKSLEICTESLGSETGSDGFSSYPTSDHGGDSSSEEDNLKEEDHYQNLTQQAQLFPSEKEKEKGIMSAEDDEVKVVVEAKYNYSAPTNGNVMKKVAAAAPRSFPPPLPSLANRGNRSNLHMRSHRQDGRLVLEAVSVPSENCFRAERQDGRLLLTFSDHNNNNNPTNEGDEVHQNESEGDEELSNADHQYECVLDEFHKKAVSHHVGDDEDKEQYENHENGKEELEDESSGEDGKERRNAGNKLAFVMDQKDDASKLQNGGGMINYVQNKFVGLTRNSPSERRSNYKLNKAVTTDMMMTTLKDKVDDIHFLHDDDGGAKPRMPSHSLPPRPPAAASSWLIPAATSSLNAYEYYWRRSNNQPSSLETAAGKGVPPPPKMVAMKERGINNYKFVELAAHNVKSIVAGPCRGGDQLEERGAVALMVRAEPDHHLFKGRKINKQHRHLHHHHGQHPPTIIPGCRRSFLFWERYCIATS